jgi:hypothetical protein
MIGARLSTVASGLIAVERAASAAATVERTIERWLARAT